MNKKKIFHEIPGGTSRNIHGIFFEPELRKLSVGTFYSRIFHLNQTNKFGRLWIDNKIKCNIP